MALRSSAARARTRGTAQDRREALERVTSALDALASGRSPGARDVLPDDGWQPIGRYSRGMERAKHAVDRVLACAALAVLSPALLVLAALVRADAGGPVIVRQRRIGCGGRPFDFWTFRTRRDRAGSGAAAGDDPRESAFGRWLRATRLDVLPALACVAEGHMSLVGPRPEIPELLPYAGGRARLLLSVRPGLLSLSGLLAREGASFEEALELDLRYVRERSPHLDARIALGALGRVLMPRLRAR